MTKCTHSDKAESLLAPVSTVDMPDNIRIKAAQVQATLSVAAALRGLTQAVYSCDIEKIAPAIVDNSKS